MLKRRLGNKIPDNSNYPTELPISITGRTMESVSSRIATPKVAPVVLSQLSKTTKFSSPTVSLVPFTTAPHSIILFQPFPSSSPIARAVFLSPGHRVNFRNQSPSKPTNDSIRHSTRLPTLAPSSPSGITVVLIPSVAPTVYTVDSALFPPLLSQPSVMPAASRMGTLAKLSSAWYLPSAIVGASFLFIILVITCFVLCLKWKRKASPLGETMVNELEHDAENPREKVSFEYPLVSTTIIGQEDDQNSSTSTRQVKNSSAQQTDAKNKKSNGRVLDNIKISTAESLMPTLKAQQSNQDDLSTSTQEDKYSAQDLLKTTVHFYSHNNVSAEIELEDCSLSEAVYILHAVTRDLEDNFEVQIRQSADEPSLAGSASTFTSSSGEEVKEYSISDSRSSSTSHQAHKRQSRDEENSPRVVTSSPRDRVSLPSTCDSIPGSQNNPTNSFVNRGGPYSFFSKRRNIDCSSVHADTEHKDKNGELIESDVHEFKHGAGNPQNQDECTHLKHMEGYPVTGEKVIAELLRSTVNSIHQKSSVKKEEVKITGPAFPNFGYHSKLDTESKSDDSNKLKERPEKEADASESIASTMKDQKSIRGSSTVIANDNKSVQGSSFSKRVDEKKEDSPWESSSTLISKDIMPFLGSLTTFSRNVSDDSDKGVDEVRKIDNCVPSEVDSTLSARCSKNDSNHDPKMRSSSAHDADEPTMFYNDAKLSADDKSRVTISGGEVTGDLSNLYSSCGRESKSEGNSNLEKKSANESGTSEYIATAHDADETLAYHKDAESSAYAKTLGTHSGVEVVEDFSSNYASWATKSQSEDSNNLKKRFQKEADASESIALTTTCKKSTQGSSNLSTHETLGYHKDVESLANVKTLGTISGVGSNYSSWASKSQSKDSKKFKKRLQKEAGASESIASTMIGEKSTQSSSTSYWFSCTAESKSEDSNKSEKRLQKEAGARESIASTAMTGAKSFRSWSTSIMTDHRFAQGTSFSKRVDEDKEGTETIASTTTGEKSTNNLEKRLQKEAGANEYIAVSMPGVKSLLGYSNLIVSDNRSAPGISFSKRVDENKSGTTMKSFSTKERRKTFRGILTKFARFFVDDSDKWIDDPRQIENCAPSEIAFTETSYKEHSSHSPGMTRKCYSQDYMDSLPADSKINVTRNRVEVKPRSCYYTVIRSGVEVRESLSSTNSSSTYPRVAQNSLPQDYSDKYLRSADNENSSHSPLSLKRKRYSQDNMDSLSVDPKIKVTSNGVEVKPRSCYYAVTSSGVEVKESLSSTNSSFTYPSDAQNSLPQDYSDKYMLSADYSASSAGYETQFTTSSGEEGEEDSSAASPSDSESQFTVTSGEVDKDNSSHSPLRMTRKCYSQDCIDSFPVDSKIKVASNGVEVKPRSCYYAVTSSGVEVKKSLSSTNSSSAHPSVAQNSLPQDYSDTYWRSADYSASSAETQFDTSSGEEGEEDSSAASSSDSGTQFTETSRDEDNENSSHSPLSLTRKCYSQDYMDSLSVDPKIKVTSNGVEVKPRSCYYAVTSSGVEVKESLSSTNSSFTYPSVAQNSLPQDNSDNYLRSADYSASSAGYETQITTSSGEEGEEDSSAASPSDSESQFTVTSGEVDKDNSSHSSSHYDYTISSYTTLESGSGWWF